MRLMLFLLVLLTAVPTCAVELHGVQFEERVQLSPTSPELMLNGLGVRKIVFIKVYVGALYAPQKTSNATDIINSNAPRRVAMALLRDVSAKQFSEALNDGLQQNHSAQELERHKAQIDELLALMMSLNEVKKGDVVRVDYLPDLGTRVQVNGENRGKIIPGPDLYRMLLRVWLGENPVDAGLKQGMLGG
ncbi:MAG TPA: chalcone isomerase family protein [Burkholderiales bacterium]|nr:chalcone isomerase family protein [Burkholderiales bacterium]